MSTTLKLIAPCGSPDFSTQKFNLDTPSLLERLLLFDTLLIKSYRIREVSSLLEKFGYNGTLALLNSGLIKIQFNITAIASMSNQHRQYRFDGDHILIPDYRFGLIQTPEREQIITNEISAIVRAHQLPTKQAGKLKNAIYRSLLNVDPREGTLAYSQLKADLSSNASIVKTAIMMAIREKTKSPIDDSRVDIEFDKHDIGIVRTNIHKLVDLEFSDLWTSIQNGVLAVGHLNQSFESMHIFDAKVGLQEKELNLLDGRFKMLYQMIDADRPIARFNRVLNLQNLPNIRNIDAFGSTFLERYIDVVRSEECIQFRRWLNTIDTLTDDELNQYLSSIRSKLGNFFTSGAGKSLRWIASTGVGFLPGGIVSGPLLGMVDTFLLDKVFPSRGPIAFLDHSYPSFFDMDVK